MSVGVSVGVPVCLLGLSVCLSVDVGNRRVVCPEYTFSNVSTLVYFLHKVTV